jgi:hypothetical protein
MTKSLADENMLSAMDRGLRLEKDGTAFGSSGRQISGSLQKTGRMRQGYLYATIKIAGTRSTTHAHFHRVQAYQKFGDKLFEKGVQVRHLNGNSLDNSWDNVALGTHQDNSMDRPKEERVRSGRIAAKAQRKLSEEEVQELRQDREEGYTYKELKEKYGIRSSSTISYIVNRKTYAA